MIIIWYVVYFIGYKSRAHNLIIPQMISLILQKSSNASLLDLRLFRCRVFSIFLTHLSITDARDMLLLSRVANLYFFLLILGTLRGETESLSHFDPHSLPLADCASSLEQDRERGYFGGGSVLKMNLPTLKPTNILKMNRKLQRRKRWSCSRGKYLEGGTEENEQDSLFLVQGSTK